jgi:hypothetical protein
MPGYPFSGNILAIYFDNFLGSKIGYSSFQNPDMDLVMISGKPQRFRHDDVQDFFCFLTFNDKSDFEFTYWRKCIDAGIAEYFCMGHTAFTL